MTHTTHSDNLEDSMSELTIKDKLREQINCIRGNCFSEHACIWTETDEKIETEHRQKQGYVDGDVVRREHDDLVTEQIMQLIDSAITEARIEAAIMGAKFGNAAFRQQSIAEPGKPIDLDVVLNSGIQQAQDWAKRTS